MEKKYPKKVDWDTYLFRCSILGELMPGPRAKEGQLQATELTALQKVWISATLGVTEDVQSKEMDKGTIQESIGIALMTKVRYPDYDLKPKNTVRFTNDYLTGEPDAIFREFNKVHDIKCPWSVRTFMQSEMTKGYEWQLRGYMWLLDLQFAELNYTLVDAPEEMIYYEVKLRAYYGGFIDESSPEFDAIERQIRHNMTFDYIPEAMRVKSFEIERDAEMEQMIIERSKLWRQTLKEMTL